MSHPEPVTRRQIAFGIAGLIFGTVIGFVAAHEIYVGRGGNPHAAAGAPPAGMPPAGMGAAGGPGPGAGGTGAPGGDMAMMDQVTRELEALKQAVEANPQDVVALTRLGNLYMDAAMFERAVDFYGKALAVDATLVDVRTDMGTCLRRLGRPEDALKEFRASTDQDPNHWKSWFNIGVVCLYDLGRYDDAEAAFERVLELNPGSFDMGAVRAEIEKLRSSPGSGDPS